MLYENMTVISLIYLIIAVYNSIIIIRVKVLAVEVLLLVCRNQYDYLIIELTSEICQMSRWNGKKKKEPEDSRPFWSKTNNYFWTT